MFVLILVKLMVLLINMRWSAVAKHQVKLAVQISSTDNFYCGVGVLLSEDVLGLMLQFNDK